MTETPTKLLVITYCKGSITAKKIAKEVVAQDHGSRVHIINEVNSFSRWVGKVDNSEQQILLIHTTSDKAAGLDKCINRLHPHELPEIIVVPLNTSLADYATDSGDSSTN